MKNIGNLVQIIRYKIFFHSDVTVMSF